MRLSDYAEHLSGLEKDRYVSKVKQCHGIDPLDLRDDEMLTDFKDYLVHETSFVTREEFKAYKSLESHNFLTSGWVQEPQIRVLPDNNVVVVGKVLECVPIAKIDFSSAKMKKRILDGERRPAAQTSSSVPLGATDEEWATFLAACHQSGCRPALLALEEDYVDEYIPVATKFPSAILTSLWRDDMPATWEEVIAECRDMADSLTLDPEVTAAIEVETKKQASSEKWFAFRAGRVTASNAKAVCRTSIDNPSQSLVRRICYPLETQFWAPQVAWGREKEGKARDAYIADIAPIHHNFRCEESGLHLSTEHPFLGATPDGLVSCTCCGKGVLEIKCPYRAKYCWTSEIPKLKNSCLTTECGKLTLKTDHQYYFQVQMQMLVCGRTYCDFVVWTTKDLFRQRIYRDREFCSEMVASCADFFLCALLPEISFKYWSKKIQEDDTFADSTSSSDSEEDDNATGQSYCHCKGPESGEMVALHTTHSGMQRHLSLRQRGRHGAPKR
ncbi:hypothetical protein HPB47_014464 [Ixodes persulcatus]|uniref:Uncharacterized protein n=1 Tax=Ixodes persulcatus TaxID=34615 RepID=A0AC60QVY2_IXOPE|nr:hypothetical protein HPB47_014464 [Ixodes persulcatus]